MIFESFIFVLKKKIVDKCASHFTLLFWEWDEHRVVSILHRKISAPRWMYIFAFIYESENKYTPPFCNWDLCWIFHYEKLWYLTMEYQLWKKSKTGKAFRLIGCAMTDNWRLPQKLHDYEAQPKLNV